MFPNSAVFVYVADLNLNLALCFSQYIIERKNILNLPDKFNLVVDDTFEMFYKGILLVKNPEIYNIKISK